MKDIFFAFSSLAIGGLLAVIVYSAPELIFVAFAALWAYMKIG